jgi:hypothetical protein
MIRKLLDEVYYTSADSWNTAIFIKKINTTALEVS